jgi:ABC-type multidrug transport system fused ATPase/permease subunit
MVQELPDGVNTQIGERGTRLSGGQRQRIGIARAIYSGAEILFFDEATSALDTETEEDITESIRELTHSNLTIIVIAHRITTLKYCDRIFQVSNGEITRETGYKEIAGEMLGLGD